ncbi:MAG: CdaR family protein [Planctomycetota bacterium]|nr:CdaR family protein [Planctomycetota bacterium]
MNWFREHWEIKVIAFILAVTVYVFTGNLIRIDTVKKLRIENQHVVGLPDDYRVRSVSPRQLTVEISGPRNLVAALDEAVLEPKLLFDPDNLEAGSQRYDVTPSLLQLSPELRIRYLGTDRIEVTVDRVVRRALPLTVGPEDFVLVTPGLIVRRVQVDHTHISVEGPKQLIDELRAAGSLHVEREVLIDVPADLVEPMERTVPVTVAVSDEVSVVTEAAITATVTVEPAPEEMPLTLPVNVLAPVDFTAGYEVELHQPQVALTVTGPSNRLRALRPERDIQAYVDLSGPLTLDIPKAHQVRVTAPLWATVSSAQVRLTVRARASAEGPAPEAAPPGEANPPPPGVEPDAPPLPPGVGREQPPAGL